MTDYWILQFTLHCSLTDLVWCHWLKTCDIYRQNCCDLCLNCRYRSLLRMTTHGLCLWRQLIQKIHRKSFHTLKKTVCVHCMHIYMHAFVLVDFVNDIKQICVDPCPLDHSIYAGRSLGSVHWQLSINICPLSCNVTNWVHVAAAYWLSISRTERCMDAQPLNYYYYYY